MLKRNSVLQSTLEFSLIQEKNTNHRLVYRYVNSQASENCEARPNSKEKEKVY